MKTIEERAKDIYPFEIYDHRECRKAYVLGATEQDRIARQEERERCINAAQDAICYLCCGCPKIGYNCEKMNSIRKAIEEGE